MKKVYEVVDNGQKILFTSSLKAARYICPRVRVASVGKDCFIPASYGATFHVPHIQNALLTTGMFRVAVYNNHTGNAVRHLDCQVREVR